MKNRRNNKKIMWKPEEDMLLKTYIQIHGEGHWSAVSKKIGLGRGGKSCRLRWKNYLRPDIKHGSMSEDEEDIIIRMHKLIGNRWALIAGRLPGRTDNEVKNYWNTYLSKKVKNSRATIKPVIKDKLIDNNLGSTQEEASTNSVNVADVAKKDNAAGGSKEHDDDDDKYWFSSDDIDFSGEIVVGPGSGAGNLSLGIMDMHLTMDQYDDQFRGFWDGENNGLIDTVGISEWVVDEPLCTAYLP